VHAARAVRYQALERAAEQLFTRISEQSLGVRVDQYHAAPAVDCDHRNRSGLDEQTQIAVAVAAYDATEG